MYGDEIGERVVTETAEEEAGGIRKELGEVVVQTESVKRKDYRYYIDIANHSTCSCSLDVAQINCYPA